MCFTIVANRKLYSERSQMTWTIEKRKRIMSVMRADLMSSEDEVSSGDETVFMVKTQSALSKRQQLKRVRNGESHRLIPVKMPESLNWALKTSDV